MAASQPGKEPPPPPWKTEDSPSDQENSKSCVACFLLFVLPNGIEE
jgi:hypothetical protein